MIDRLIDWMIDDSLIDWLIDWLIDDWLMIDWLIDWLIDWSIDDWLTDWTKPTKNLRNLVPQGPKPSQNLMQPREPSPPRDET